MLFYFKGNIINGLYFAKVFAEMLNLYHKLQFL
jgi:hypothetical protein